MNLGGERPASQILSNAMASPSPGHRNPPRVFAIHLLISEIEHSGITKPKIMTNIELLIYFTPHPIRFM